MDTATKTLADLIQEHGFTMTASNPTPKSDPEWPGATRWAVTLYNNENGHEMTVPFHTGSAWGQNPPTIEEVLDCLASDATSIEDDGDDFERWASNLGYDTDSRKVLAVYEATQEQTAQLRDLLDNLYEAIIYAERN